MEAAETSLDAVVQVMPPAGRGMERQFEQVARDMRAVLQSASKDAAVARSFSLIESKFARNARKDSATALPDNARQRFIQIHHFAVDI
ncbi:MAG: hypothetical protein ABFD92_01145 [Planctomycetaceae bacterium]|nr:hypothetical protein [Planctomycetaceae bacterium]